MSKTQTPFHEFFCEEFQKLSEVKEIFNYI